MFHGIKSQPFPVYSSLHLSNFLSILTLNNAIFVTHITATFQSRLFMFSKQINIKILCRWIVIQPYMYLVCSSCICLISFHSILRIKKFFVRDIMSVVAK